MSRYFRARDRPQTVRNALRRSPFQERTVRVRHKMRKQAGRNVRRVKRRTPPKVMRSVRTVLAKLPPQVEDSLRKSVRKVS